MNTLLKSEGGSILIPQPNSKNEQKQRLLSSDSSINSGVAAASEFASGASFASNLASDGRSTTLNGDNSAAGNGATDVTTAAIGGGGGDSGVVLLTAREANPRCCSAANLARYGLTPGISAMILSSIMFSFVQIFVKQMVNDGVSVYFILMQRNFVQLILGLFSMWYQNIYVFGQRKHRWGMIGRGIVGGGSIGLYYLSLQLMPLTIASVLGFTVRPTTLRSVSRGWPHVWCGVVSLCPLSAVLCSGSDIHCDIIDYNIKRESDALAHICDLLMLLRIVRYSTAVILIW